MKKNVTIVTASSVYTIELSGVCKANRKPIMNIIESPIVKMFF
jgi:hypothetical protein